MGTPTYHRIKGKEDGLRVSSRVLEERIQKAVGEGRRNLHIEAFGQHGIGGRLWEARKEITHVRIEGPPGQRLGAMALPNTFIEVLGPASDDVGWLNAGAEIVIHGNAGNGVANGMAQGKIFVDGNVGARAMTMTKHNPRFDPPELWLLGSAGDYLGEFIAGGIAVICGVEPQPSQNILGYRPLVGMVGERIFFRGPHGGYSQADAKQVAVDDRAWNWLTQNLKLFLERIGRTELWQTLCDRQAWQLLEARSPAEKAGPQKMTLHRFRETVWEKELGAGGLIGDLVHMERTSIAPICTGNLRRFVLVWENRAHLAPCEAGCPSGIPVHERWRLIREGRVDEAVDLALAYTPFPATVCGYLCPNLCMQSCTRQISSMAPVDTTQIGKASIKAGLPDFPPESGSKVAVIGGGPAGISIAWQLRREGFGVTIFDMRPQLGGKIVSTIPRSRIPDKVVDTEIERVKKVIAHVHLQQRLTRRDWQVLKQDFDFVVVATGAQIPRTLPMPGNERLITATDFLKQARRDEAAPGKNVVIIGAGNVGCDVAAEASRLGSENITLIDIQEPASFGKERAAAEAAGAEFRWPCFTKEISVEGVVLDTGEVIPADTVFISIGDMPDLDVLPPEVDVEQGFIKVDASYRTSDPQIFAIGDAVRPGLLTDAIGAGRQAAAAIKAVASGQSTSPETRRMIGTDRVTLEYFDPRITLFENLEECGSACASCGACRDCGTCVAICPQSAISRVPAPNDAYEYVVDDARCIGCGFCAGACPCGIWDLIENAPLDVVE